MGSDPGLSSMRSTGSKSGLDRAKWITNQANILFCAYRRDDFAAPDGFLIQLAQVLEAYPDHIIAEITSPRTGLQRRSKFPPTIAEVVTACETEMERLSRIQRMQPLKAVPPQAGRAPEQRYNLFVGGDRPGYAKMCELATKADPRDYKHENGGIWVPLPWWDRRAA